MSSHGMPVGRVVLLLIGLALSPCVAIRVDSNELLQAARGQAEGIELVNNPVDDENEEPPEDLKDYGAVEGDEPSDDEEPEVWAFGGGSASNDAEPTFRAQSR